MLNKFINIGGEDRPVNFGRNFWNDVEVFTGKNISKILADYQNELTSHRNGTAIVYSALKWGLYDTKKGLEPKPSFTIFQVGDWLDDRPEAQSEIYSLLIESMPSSKNAEAGGDPAK